MRSHPVLDRARDAGIRLGLDAITRFLQHLGAPHKRLRVVHVAGSNGKGSTVAMLEACLVAAGHRTGVTVSPHIQHVNERIRVDGSPIEDEVLDRLLFEIDGKARAWAEETGLQNEQPLTYFELMTVCAFVHMARSQVDVAIVEVGLGGRLDATNVVEPEVTAVTSISLDHTDRLGFDLASIAGEKAGIVKPERPVVLGEMPPIARTVIRSVAVDREAPRVVLGEDAHVTPTDSTFRYDGPGGRREALTVGLAGRHQLDNAGVVIAVLDLLAERVPELVVPDEALRDGLERAVHPGRLEWLADDLLIDGAHNPEGAQRLAQYLSGLPRPGARTLILGGGADKDLRSVAAAIAPQVDRIYTSRCSHFKATEPGDVAAALVDLGVPVMPAGAIEEALPAARERGGLVVVAGSLFLAGAVRDLVR
ncbi:MAG: bifunctional folylpolyglutamate synthase/dihydrofolate synthase [Proteobacteria bacterium]|nr:bifunctional folylpolyglutamate synthase/dihydrofolate synthase [Pseudomonadota bacterium]MCP4915323.1 bifunctional folylpolyglutamate synthase/dihydrofolate synthase [Pseudomonadota bacterium]